MNPTRSLQYLPNLDAQQRGKQHQSRSSFAHFLTNGPRNMTSFCIAVSNTSVISYLIIAPDTIQSARRAIRSDHQSLKLKLCSMLHVKRFFCLSKATSLPHDHHFTGALPFVAVLVICARTPWKLNIRCHYDLGESQEWLVARQWKVLGDENITGRKRMKITITRMAIIKDNENLTWISIAMTFSNHL